MPQAPIGGWAQDPKLREIGQYGQLALEQDLEGNIKDLPRGLEASNHRGSLLNLGYVTFMWNTVMQWPQDEMHMLLMQFRKELRAKSIHSYVPLRTVVARKPV